MVMAVIAKPHSVLRGFMLQLHMYFDREPSSCLDAHCFLAIIICPSFHFVYFRRYFVEIEICGWPFFGPPLYTDYMSNGIIITIKHLPTLYKNITKLGI